MIESSQQEIAELSMTEVKTILDDENFLRACSARLSRPTSEIVSRIQTSLSEAAVGLSLLEGIDLAGKPKTHPLVSSTMTRPVLRSNDPTAPRPSAVSQP